MDRINRAVIDNQIGVMSGTVNDGGMQFFAVYLQSQFFSDLTSRFVVDVGEQVIAWQTIDVTTKAHRTTLYQFLLITGIAAAIAEYFENFLFVAIFFILDHAKECHVGKNLLNDWIAVIGVIHYSTIHEESIPVLHFRTSGIQTHAKGLFAHDEVSFFSGLL